MLLYQLLKILFFLFKMPEFEYKCLIPYLHAHESLVPTMSQLTTFILDEFLFCNILIVR